ncbi:T9SS type A sorting domain-containing protein [Flavobacterium alkalisoli]|uniref:T9SS type A sorting domain-containing protein n=1 Tax=Flavobacterium alkalisoli TaxID=2602769 RepID=A0A5B9FNI0_9FLAO|nr:T9SS type A sorting domain-containing protein [Flavobacterium alkalisoli]QEE48470.1 T9SS type A sorting domain-containing protein [Flavobacterium alkalisoli]
MKKMMVLCLLLLGNYTLQAQDVLWDRSYGGKQADYLLDVQPTADYGFILAGSSLSLKGGNKEKDNHGDLDYWLWKMNENGELDWQKDFGGEGTDILYSIKNTNDGGFILAGTSTSGISEHKKDSCRGREDIWIIKLNAKGGEEWQKTYGGNNQDLVKCISQTSDGGYIVGASSTSDMSLKIKKGGSDSYGKSQECIGGLDYWIFKLDKKGNIKWQRTLGGDYLDIIETISETKDGGYIVGGYSNSPSSRDKGEESKGEGDYWVLKLDVDGNTEWEKVFGGDDDDHLSCILPIKDDGYLLGGYSASSSTGNKNKSNKKGTDIWLIKIDQEGDILWQETYDIGKTDILLSLLENKDGTYLLGGHAKSEVFGLKKSDKKEINDYVAIKVSSDGEELWKKAIGSKGEDVLQKLIETRDGGYIMAGTSDGAISRDKNSGNGSHDFWVVKFKDKDKREENNRLKIEAIPNPAVQYTNIIVGFDFNTGTCRVYDLAGRQLQSFTVNNRTIPLEMQNYPEGIYIVEVSTDTGIESVKVMKGKNN